MAGTASVFGRQTSQEVASKVLNSAALNATGAPSTPQNVPTDELTTAYARLLAACYEIKKLDKDTARLLELEQCEAFADRALREFGEGPEPLGTPVAAAPPSQPMAPNQSQAVAPPAPGPQIPPAAGPPVTGAPPQ